MCDRLTGCDPLVAGHQHVEVPPAQVHGVDPDVDQHVQAVVGGDAQRVLGPGDRPDPPGDRGSHQPRARGADRRSGAEQTSGEHGVGDLRQCDHLAAQRRTDHRRGGRFRTRHGRSADHRGSGHRGGGRRGGRHRGGRHRGGRHRGGGRYPQRDRRGTRLSGRRQRHIGEAQEPSEGEREDHGRPGPGQLHPERPDAQVGGQGEEPGEHEAVGGRPARRGDRPTDRTRRAGVHEGAAQPQGHAVDRGLGDPRDDGTDRGRTGQCAQRRVAGAQEHREGGRALGQHGGDQGAGQQRVPLNRQVVDHHRHEPPVHAEDHEHLPQAAHQSPGDRRAEPPHPADRLRHGVRHRRAQGSEQDDGGGHQQGQADRGDRDEVQRLGQPSAQPGLQDREHDRRDERGQHRLAVLDDRDGDAQEAGAGPGRAEAGEVLVEQGRGDHPAEVRVRPELLRRGDADQDRKEVERGVAGGGPDRVGRAAGADPAELNGQGEEGLDHAGADQCVQQRMERARDQVEQPVPPASGRRGGLGLPTVPRGRHEVAHPSLHLADVVADHHLQLAGPLDRAGDAGQATHRLLAGLALVDQDQAQPGRAVPDRADVGRAADPVDDPLGQRVDVHQVLAASRARSRLTCTIR